jgi:urease accessory protein
MRAGERAANGAAILPVLSLATPSIIHSALEHKPGEDEQIVLLTADRATLAKKRWRGLAQDGREFGFDLEHTLSDGSVIFREAGRCYVILQAAEPIVTIELGSDPRRAALLAWQIGNLHFPVEVTDRVICCQDDPAIRQMLQREHIAWRENMGVFRPSTSAGHAHHH